MLHEIFEVLIWVMTSYVQSFGVASMNLQGVLDEHVAAVFIFILDLYESGNLAWLSLTTLGMIATKYPTPERGIGLSIGTRIQSLVTAAVQQLTAARNHDCYAQGITDHAEHVLNNIGVQPTVETIRESDENSQVEYKWTSFLFLDMVRITIERYPFNTIYTVTILDKIALSNRVYTHFLAESDAIKDDNPHAFGDEYTDEGREKYDADMDELVKDCDAVAALRDAEQLVPYGTQSHKLIDYYSVINAELSMEATDRHCTQTDLLAPYSSILESVKDANTPQPIDTAIPDDELILANARWTYP